MRDAAVAAAAAAAFAFLKRQTKQLGRTRFVVGRVVVARDAATRARATSALSFAEVKTHKTYLLKQMAVPYRKESWQISDELSGGIAQVQRSVQVSLENIRSRTDVTDDAGSQTGERLFLYKPRSVLVIGSLSEFQGSHGINEEKYSSFELFRRNISSPEIITFDELFERARFIVETEKEE